MGYSKIRKNYKTKQTIFTLRYSCKYRMLLYWGKLPIVYKYYITVVD